MGGEAAGGDAAAGTGAVPSAAAHDRSQAAGLRDYWRVLAAHRHFRYLWCAEMVDNIGGWLSYVATLELVERYSGGSGLAISAVVIIRFLPSLLLAPMCGVVADRVNRIGVLVVAALVDAGVVALLAGVPLLHAAQVPALYLLLTLQFSAAAFYEPARKAIVPVLVPPEDLHLATTIDSFAWSITGAVGASAGGVVASRLGVGACFVADAVTYLVAAWCAQQVPRELGAPDAAARQLKKHASMRQVEMAGLLGPAAHEPASRAAEAAEGGHGHAAAAAGLTHAEHRHHPHDQGAAAWEPASPEAGAQSEHELLNGGGLGQGPAGNGAGGGLLAAGAAALAEGWRATREGWDYITARHNSEVRALVLMKCAAALTWGAVDVLNVRFSQTPAMQALGDSSTTLGLIFAVVGFGCFVGPVVLNSVFPPQPHALRWGVATSYILFFAGFLLMLVAGASATGGGPAHAAAAVAALPAPRPSARPILLVLLSTFVRSTGSAALWVYSTLLMQQRVANELLGRISAIEGALYTISESASSVFGGAAFDVLHLSLPTLLAILTTMAGIMSVGWCVYAWAANRSSSRDGRPRSHGGAYLPVRQHDGAAT